MNQNETITLFLVAIIALTGLIIVFNSFAISGNAGLIDSLLNWIKPLEQKITEEKNAGIYEENNEPKAKDLINQYREEDSSQTLQTQNSKLQTIHNSKPQTTNSLLPVVGSWRAYSQAIFYDSGTSNWINKPSTRKLNIHSDGTWEYGSTGTWNVQPINDADWRKWNVQPYGPTKKIVLNGWSNSIGTGPIEEGSQGIDFIWVIYRSEKLSLGPATIQIKFGH